MFITHTHTHQIMLKFGLPLRVAFFSKKRCNLLQITPSMIVIKYFYSVTMLKLLSTNSVKSAPLSMP